MRIMTATLAVATLALGSLSLDSAMAQTAPAAKRATDMSAQSNSASDVHISRSSQADAARLDEELSGMLREQFSRVFVLFQPVGA